MDAVVIAGGIPQPKDPLYPFTQGGPKALLPIAGKPMVQWVLEALDGADRIERVVMVGLAEEQGVVGRKVSAWLPNAGEMTANICRGVDQVLARNPAAVHVAIVSADIPAVQPSHVDWVVERAEESDDDVYYTVISREVMEKRFPESRRSYVRLKDVEVCGGDLNVIRAALVHDSNPIWQRLLAARKNAFKQAALLGFDTLLLLLLRQVTLEQAVQRASRRLGVKGRALLSPFAELGMDVDKPHQLELLRADLERRMGNPG